MQIKLSPTEIDFIEKMGLLAQDDGLPKIAGRLWGLFMVVGDVLSFSEIAEILQISRGSVSTNAKVLQNLDVLERRSIPGERQDFFAIKSNPYSSLLEASLKRQKEKLAVVKLALKDIERPAAQGQLKDLLKFYEVLNNSFSKGLSDLNKYNKKNTGK